MDVPCRAKGNAVVWTEGDRDPGPSAAPVPDTDFSKFCLLVTEQSRSGCRQTPQETTGQITIISELEIDPLLP